MREGSETISKESRTFVRSGDRHLLMDEDIVRGGTVKGIIYCAYNKINNKRYIGQTIQRLSERKSAHYNKNGCPYFHHALLKYAVTDWDWFILDECNSLEELNEKKNIGLIFMIQPIMIKDIISNLVGKIVNLMMKKFDMQDNDF